MLAKVERSSAESIRKETGKKKAGQKGPSHPG